MDRKGQAAMEFLMTYGWAILAAIIAIGVLAYFGVFSPGKYVSGSTVVNPPFYANAWSVQAHTVQLELKNNGGEIYNVTEVIVVDADGATCTTGPIGLNVDVGGVQAFTLDDNVTGVTACATAATGESYKGDITVKYTKAGSTLEMTSTGTIAEKVTA